MNRFIKKLLLWLLIAILPVQGMAAVLKANCGPRHHAVSISASVGSELSAEHVHAPNEELESSDFYGAAVVAEAVENDSSVTEPASPSDHYASYCSACAACCTGAVAPPVSLSAVSAPSSAEDIVIPPTVSYLGFIPAGLERPPKTFSA